MRVRLPPPAFQSLLRLVAKQLATGVEVVSDGEFRRLFFTSSSDSAFSGFEPGTLSIPFLDSEGEAFRPPRPVATRRLEKVRNSLAEEAQYLSR
jgi:methionine synthase II (cobalamin-independent)